MDRTLENEFFKEFEYSSAACGWLRWLKWKNNLNDNDSTATMSREVAEKFYDLFLKVTIPQMPQITETLEWSMDDPLYNEIAANLEECKSDEEKERYVGSLITPFKHFSNLCLPHIQFDRVQCKIKDIERCVADIVDLPADEMLVSPSDYITPVMTVGERLDQCNAAKAEAEAELENIHRRWSKFMDLSKKNTSYSSHIAIGVLAYFFYSTRLDALLLTHYIDLMELQKHYGVYFTENRFFDSVASNVGSRELTQKYIDEINRRKEYKTSIEIKSKDNLKQTTQAVIPVELDTGIARKIFAKAVERGLMEWQNDHYEWLVKRGKSLLAYMLDKIYKNGAFPETELNKLFNETRLGKARTQLYNNKGGAGRDGGKPQKYKMVDILFREV